MAKPEAAVVLPSIEERVKEIALEVLLVEAEELTPNVKLREDLGLDSLDRVELAMRLEEELLDGERIDAEADRWTTYQDVVNTVRQKLEGRTKP